MRVTTKGQVTIPRNIRERLGIIPETNIDFEEENGRFYIVKTTNLKSSRNFVSFKGRVSFDFVISTPKRSSNTRLMEYQYQLLTFLQATPIPLKMTGTQKWYV